MGPWGERLGPARSRERFLLGEPVEEGVRGAILHSWERCRLLGLSPDQSELPWTDEYDPDSRLVRAATPVLDRLANRFAGSRMNICLADANGTVLERRFGEPSLARSLPPIQTVPGFVFAERVAGTNGIGLALAERQLIRVHGAEHFAERSQANACAATPVRDQLSGRILGVLCFGYPRDDDDPALAVQVRRAAEAIERRLMEQSSARERALLRTYLDAARRARAGGPAGVNGRPGPVGLDELAGGLLAGRPLDPHDETILKEKAAELIGSPQRSTLEVVLPHGRGATLLSHAVTSPAGVAGVVVEAVLTGDAAPPAHSLATGPATTAQPTAAPAPAPATASAPATAPAPAAGSAPTGGGSGRGDVRGLVLVGEPEVGRYAVAARRRLELLAEASGRIGTTLDVSRTAWELAEVAVPRVADYVTIDLPEAVLRGEEAADPTAGLYRTVVHGIRDDCPFYPVGQRVELRPETPHMRSLTSGEAVLETDLTSATGWIAQGPDHARRILAHQVHSLICVPLLARGVLLGIATFYRSEDPEPFGEDDSRLAQELAARAALCIDNARQYTREHTLALSLQRSLLPRGLPELAAVEVAHRYLPAESGVGGDWFDVIPLSGTRVALVVGDVVGHGLLAAATMGRLRTAARNFAELELAPDELLTHLDNLLVRLDREESGDAEGSSGIVGATCLYAVYDPTTRQCTMARAGHPPPALVRPDGSVSLLDLPAGPPLGLGGLPFETAEVVLPEDSTLVLYTDGLVEDRERDIEAALDELQHALARAGRTPEDTCQAVIEAMAPAHPSDDIALLVARTHGHPAERIATWELPADPARVAGVRAAVTRQLAEWGLDELAFAAELMLSELVTNAVRYGGEPIQVRLIHDRALICEVADGSSTAPHLRRAASEDEGGRGLFLVAQLAQSWGTRYTPRGKVIWAECALDAA
ncbi:SpoIIE family protein phosphatase [Streptomyces antimicrobicus]|uniref:SpoIIE family protein phosphatase n=1 Tax=Streptomyces antimicrobicus TaxID=2883108 RepID=A0ABS8B1A1_9ACTN|nr:SpoIIE family protein phosphatase [Streptomyces antimicrobicus]MCB5178368.1 SpoIIE family protein phosphatase [Streptomyces antimicrobicus]